jgi:hypothetical protein
MKVRDQEQSKKGFAFANSWLPNPWRAKSMRVQPCSMRIRKTTVSYYRYRTGAGYVVNTKIF